MTEESATPPVTSDAEIDLLDRDHLRKEAWTMGLYVTVCLLAALTALESVIAVPGRVLGLVWGTMVGLALAHLFAFRIAGRLVHDGRLARSDQIVSAVQLAAAAVIALMVSIPVLIATPESELAWARAIPAPPSLVWPVMAWLAVPRGAGLARCSSDSESSPLR